MTPRGTLEYCCVYIFQSLTYQAMSITLFTLELWYKPLGILKRINKSENVLVSSHDGLRNVHNINFA